MYNEDEELFKATLQGIIQNYNVMSMTENFKAGDMMVCLVCDGFNGIPERMKDYLRKHRLFDERTLQEKGFMEEKDNEEGKKKFKMKAIKNCMEDKSINKDIEITPPKNILHLFQVSTWNFGLDQDHLSGRRINFCFGLKHNNDGKINSHKWFF